MLYAWFRFVELLLTCPDHGVDPRAHLAVIDDCAEAHGGTCQPDSDSSLKINVDFVAVSLAADRVGKFTTL